jgi:branched-chain amino acid transport system ATP-binding protein
MLEVQNLTVAYGEIVALRAVSFSIQPGEIVTLIGGNGAGKSTMLRTISGLTPIKEGSITLHGRPIGGLSVDQIVAMGIAQVPEGRRVFSRLSVQDNLTVGAHMVEARAQINTDIEDIYTTFPRLKERRHQFAESLSGGEQQMLAIGRAMMCRPKLLLLDEPSLGLAPLVVEDVARTILSLRKRGITILLVEQNARVALAIADRGYVIENGRITFSDTASALRRDPRVVESYLGGRASTDMKAAAVSAS